MNNTESNIEELLTDILNSHYIFLNVLIYQGDSSAYIIDIIKEDKNTAQLIDRYVIYKIESKFYIQSVNGGDFRSFALSINEICVAIAHYSLENNGNCECCILDIYPELFNSTEFFKRIFKK